MLPLHSCLSQRKLPSYQALALSLQGHRLNALFEVPVMSIGQGTRSVHNQVLSEKYFCISRNEWVYELY